MRIELKLKTLKSSNKNLKKGFLKVHVKHLIKYSSIRNLKFVQGKVNAWMECLCFCKIIQWKFKEVLLSMCHLICIVQVSLWQGCRNFVRKL